MTIESMILLLAASLSVAFAQEFKGFMTSDDFTCPLDWSAANVPRGGVPLLDSSFSFGNPSTSSTSTRTIASPSSSPVCMTFFAGAESVQLSQLQLSGRSLRNIEVSLQIENAGTAFKSTPMLQANLRDATLTKIEHFTMKPGHLHTKACFSYRSLEMSSGGSAFSWDFSTSNRRLRHTNDSTDRTT